MLKTQNLDQISPLTGWTIREWQNAAATILENIYPNLSEAKALIRFSASRTSIYGQFSDMVESFTRTFILVGFWLKNRNTGVMKLKNGESVDWAEIFREGILSGTDKNHGEYWGEINGKHQYMVESASLVIGLYFSRKMIWDTYNSEERQQIGDWLRKILQFPFEDKNWVLFGVIINAFLKATGQEYYQDQIDFYLERFNSYYEADGWYRDGIAPQYDLYNSWALHYYPHFWSEIDPDIRRPEYIRIFEDRSRYFLEKFSYLFSSTASHPAFGRSLIYRCAAVSAAIIGIWKGFSPLPAGLTRRICSQSLKYFSENGLFASDGSIPLGWTGKFDAMAEKYSGPGSSLWVNKIFSAFLLQTDHPFWTKKEEPLPVEEKNFCIFHKVPGFLINGHKKTGHIQLINQGSDSYVNGPTNWKNKASDNHYNKFAYSSHLFHDIGPTDEGLNCGNMISLIEKKRGISERLRIYPTHISDRVAISFHFPFGELYGEKRDSRIETAVVMKDDHQIRIHWIISPNRPFVVEGGYTLADDNAYPQIKEGSDWILVFTEKGTSCIRGLAGYDLYDVSCAEGNNPSGKYSATPVVKTSGQVLAQQFVACEIIARPGTFDLNQELGILSCFRFVDRSAEIYFIDGERVRIKLGNPESGEEVVNWNF